MRCLMGRGWLSLDSYLPASQVMTTDFASHPDRLGLSDGALAKVTTTVTPGSKARQPGALETPRPESGSRARGGAGCQSAISHTATVASPRVSFTQFIALFSGQLAVWSFSQRRAPPTLARISRPPTPPQRSLVRLTCNEPILMLDKWNDSAGQWAHRVLDADVNRETLEILTG
ncbi:hypothetical protein LA080_006646 [Diaporthe eres]|nr:hypothetical protein LA080_006646 [Diaporthe eres]